jgi:mannose/cellobiose epimerase-like protein (N-acyl-D-glucosamine 2-epimerase family)
VPHLQNPHMHLTEAMLVLRDSTGHPRFAAEADRLVSLCLRHFYDDGSATLTEEFDAAWARDPHVSKVEPGHHYEWVWLLHRYLGSERHDRDVEHAMRRLFDFAVRFGQDPRTGLVRDGIDPDGRVALPDHRLWPQAERLKAWLAMAERHGTDPGPAVREGLDGIFRHYLATDPAGTWIDHRTAALAPRVDKIPASSFYHLVLAFAEVLRRHDLVEGGPG